LFSGDGTADFGFNGCSDILETFAFGQPGQTNSDGTVRQVSFLLFSICSGIPIFLGGRTDCLTFGITVFAPLADRSGNVTSSNTSTRIVLLAKVGLGLTSLACQSVGIFSARAPVSGRRGCEHTSSFGTPDATNT
jgi:hypothetical protein